MKTVTYKQIKEFGPCYDPVKYIPETYEGTALDILKMNDVSAKDRLWVCVRAELLTDKQIHLYGLGCARLSEKYSTDPRVKECNDVTERYIAGNATKEELSAARSAAESAARSAAWSARSAAESARSAAWSARSAAESAARSAAWSAARSAAWSARSARSAAESARSAAWSAARSAAWSAAESAENEQVLLLIKILETNNE